MSQALEELLMTIGIIVLIATALLVVYVANQSEVVFINTFEKGLVKIDEDTEYSCKLTEKSKRIREAKGNLEKLRK